MTAASAGAIPTSSRSGATAGAPARPPSTCTAPKQYEDGLCYDPCKSGFTGGGPVCWGACEAGWIDDGALCRKPLNILVKY